MCLVSLRIIIIIFIFFFSNVQAGLQCTTCSAHLQLLQPTPLKMAALQTRGTGNGGRMTRTQRAEQHPHNNQNRR